MDLSLTGLSHELVFDPLGSENICTTNKDIPSLFLLMTKKTNKKTHNNYFFYPRTPKNCYIHMTEMRLSQIHFVTSPLKA